MPRLLTRTAPPLDARFEVNRDSMQARGLVGWWPTIGGNGGYLSNYAGRGRLAMAGVNNPTMIVDPMIGSMVNLNGTNQYYGVIGALPVFQQTTPFSVSCWLASTDTDAVILSNWSALVSPGWQVDWNAGSVRGLITNAGVSAGRLARTTSTTLNTGLLTHVVAVWAGTSLASGWSFYINGQLVAATTILDTTPGTLVDYAVVMGGGLSWMTGPMGDMRVYDRALTARDVWQIYAPQTRWELYQVSKRRSWQLGFFSGAATLGIQVGLAPSGNQLVSSIATPGIQAAFVPVANGIVTGGATLGIQAALAPIANQTAPVVTTTGIQVALGPVANGLASSTTVPGIQAALGGIGNQIALAVTTPGIQATLTSVSNGLAVGSALPGIQTALAATANQLVQVTASLSLTASLASVANGLATALSIPGVTLALASVGVSGAVSIPGVQLALASVANGLATITVSSGIQAALVTVASGLVASSVAPGIQAALMPSANGLVVGGSALNVQANLASQATGLASGTAAPAIQASLSPQSAVAVIATPFVTLALSSVSNGIALTSTALAVQIALVPIGNISGGSGLVVPGIVLGIFAVANGSAPAATIPMINMFLTATAFANIPVLVWPLMVITIDSGKRLITTPSGCRDIVSASSTRRVRTR